MRASLGNVAPMLRRAVQALCRDRLERGLNAAKAHRSREADQAVLSRPRRPLARLALGADDKGGCGPLAEGCGPFLVRLFAAIVNPARSFHEVEQVAEARVNRIPDRLRFKIVGDKHGYALAPLVLGASALFADRDAAVFLDIEVVERDPPLCLVCRARATASLALSSLVIPNDFEGSACSRVELELTPLIERLRATRCWHCSLRYSAAADWITSLTPIAHRSARSSQSSCIPLPVSSLRLKRRARSAMSVM
jgi:hypothetical protein